MIDLGRPWRATLAPFAWREVSRPAAALVIGLVLVRAGVYLMLGVHLVLDDWDMVYLSDQFGTVDFVTDYWQGRPVAGLVDAALFHGIGAHPLALFAVVTLLNLLAALLLLAVLGRFVAPRAALAVTAVWVVSANHSSLTVWPATAPSVTALVLLLGGILSFTTDRWPWAAPCLALASLSYELVIPACLLAVAVLPSTERRSVWQRSAVAAPTLLAAAWVLAHPVYEDEPIPEPDVALLWRAHFSEGLLGTVDGPVRLVHWLGDTALVGLVVCVVAWLLGRRDRDAGPWLALAGLLVMVAGSAGFLRVGLGFRSVGFFDRLLAVSSIGAAMVVVGIAQLVWRASRPVAVVAGVTLGVTLVAGSFVALRSWSAAGDDVEAALAFVDRTRPVDGATADVAIGPSLRQHNGVPSTSSAYDMLMIANRVRGWDHLGEVRTVDGGAGTLVASGPGERLIDWRWIEDAQFFDGGVGFVEDAHSPAPQAVTITGWAQAGPPDAGPVEVAVIVDGGPVESVLADRTRPDLATAVGQLDPDHGFEATVEVSDGTHTVCARTVGLGAVSLGCREVEVGASPTGPP